MKITIFSEELRECLNAAGLSDCGENDTWNYWYQRLMSAYNESIERQIMTEQAENDRLQEQLAEARDPQRIGGTADPESFAYAIEQLREFRWQHATNDEEAIPYINNVADAHERENAKLRELVKSMYYDLTNMTFPPDWVTDYEADMRELGLEVEG